MSTVPGILVLLALTSSSGAAASPRLFRDDAPWALFPAGAVPGERPGTVGPETFGACPWLKDKGSDEFVGERCYLNVTVPTLTPHLVAGSTAAVIVAPGGGYKALSWDNEGTSVASWLNTLGISAFILKYRVPSRPWLDVDQPGASGGAAFMDAQRAMGLVRSRAQALGLNASRIGFMGFSAGGHLTAHVSTTNFSGRSYARIDAADDLSSRPDFAVLGYPWVVNLDSSSGDDTVFFNVTKEHPPSFLVQAMDDPTCPVDNSLLYYLALKRAGAPPSELHAFPRGKHGFGVCAYAADKSLEVCGWPQQAARFLKGVLLDSSSEVGERRGGALEEEAARRGT